ncbi:hypothetical protein ACTG9Q_02220 [Actinokineospora sp. 24-640]
MSLRRGVAAVVAVLGLAACAEPEPLAVPEDLRRQVEALLGAGAAITGETCDSLPVDAPTEGNHRYRAGASVPGDPAELVESLRAKAIGDGWQPQRAPEFDLALAGPRPGTQLAAKRTGSGLDVEVLVEHRCSSTSALFRADGPELTDRQRSRLAGLDSAVTEMMRGIYAEFGDVPPSWPERPPPENLTGCQAEGRAGVRWPAPETPELTVPDPERLGDTISGAVPEAWEVTAERSTKDVKGVVTTPVAVRSTVEGFAVEVPFEAITFTGGVTKLFYRGAEVCVPAA